MCRPIETVKVWTQQNLGINKRPTVDYHNLIYAKKNRKPLKRAHIAAWRGFSLISKSGAIARRKRDVISALRFTAVPKWRLAPRNKSLLR